MTAVPPENAVGEDVGVDVGVGAGVGVGVGLGVGVGIVTLMFEVGFGETGAGFIINQPFAYAIKPKTARTRTMEIARKPAPESVLSGVTKTSAIVVRGKKL